MTTHPGIRPRPIVPRCYQIPLVSISPAHSQIYQHAGSFTSYRLAGMFVVLIHHKNLTLGMKHVYVPFARSRLSTYMAKQGSLVRGRSEFDMAEH
jgi:hypothetical protein